MIKKLICLIPTWNEEWILDFTLKQNSQVFDFIIILDQMSFDRTKQIASKYKNVILKNNLNNSFNEDERQIVLIDYARNMFPNSVLFALDADEILFTRDINAFRLEVSNYSLGINLYMPWVDIFPNLRKAITTVAKQFAYVDDGIEHRPLSMHSHRLPFGKQNINLQNAVVFHLQYLNLNRNRSKHLWYIHYEMANFNVTNRIILLSKYLHFVFRKKNSSSQINVFCDEFANDIKRLEKTIDIVWNERLKNDFPEQNKIILDVYDYFVFNKKINFISSIYALLTYIHFRIFLILHHFKKYIIGRSIS